MLLRGRYSGIFRLKCTMCGLICVENEKSFKNSFSTKHLF